jgi:hypothetical protein
MTKVILTMIFCTAVYEQCQAPFVMPAVYDNFYECMIAGYEEAQRKTIAVGTERVNKDGIYIKFYCVNDNRTKA